MIKLISICSFLILSSVGSNAQSLERSIEAHRRDSVFTVEISKISNLWDSLSTIRPSKYHRFGYSASGMMNANDTCLTEWDKLLNKYYNLLKSELPYDQFVVLRDSQRKWLIYREQELDFLLSTLPDGMIYNELFAGRRTAIVAERVTVLHSIYSQIPDLTKSRIIEHSDVRIIGW